MKTFLFAFALFVSCLGLADGALPSKINLLLVDVGTIDTVAKTEKFMAAMDKVALPAPPEPSPADATVDPDLRKAAVRLNFVTGVAEYLATKEAVAAENARKRKILEGLRNSIVGNKENRMVIIAKDYLASGLEDYSDFIAVVDRSDAALSEVEKAISNHDQDEIAPATLFLSVTLGDLQHVQKQMQVGGALVKRDIYTRKATAKVSDFNNVRVFSCDVTASYNSRSTDAVEVSGETSAIAEALIEDAMRQIARKVGAKFVKEFLVTVKIPNELKDVVSEDSIELYLDRVAKTGDDQDVLSEGIPISAGEPFKALSVNHTVTAIVSEDGYVAKPAKIVLGGNKTKGVIRIQKKK